MIDIPSDHCTSGANLVTADVMYWEQIEFGGQVLVALRQAVELVRAVEHPVARCNLQGRDNSCAGQICQQVLARLLKCSGVRTRCCRRKLWKWREWACLSSVARSHGRQRLRRCSTGRPWVPRPRLPGGRSCTGPAMIHPEHRTVLCC